MDSGVLCDMFASDSLCELFEIKAFRTRINNSSPLNAQAIVDMYKRKWVQSDDAKAVFCFKKKS